MQRVASYQRRWAAIFAATLAALVVLAVCLYLRLPSYRQPAVDFYSMGSGAIFSVHGLTRRQEGSLKLGFGETYDPPEIGAYGNHIISYFGADAFGRPGDAAYFFNYYFANLSLPEVHRYLRHIERVGRLPRRLILVQITPPNADNGHFIINWGNELPPDVLLSDLDEDGVLSSAKELLSVAWELANNWLHELLNYNTFISGLLQRGAYQDRIVDPATCQGDLPGWLNRLPYTAQNMLGAFAGHAFYCLRRTWWGAFRRDGSADFSFREYERAPGEADPPPVRNEDPLNDTQRALKAGDELEIARQMRAIAAVGDRHGLRVVFFVPPVYETDRHDSVVNRIFNQALALVPDLAVIDHRSFFGDASLFESSLHPAPKYYAVLVEELRRRGFLE